MGLARSRSGELRLLGVMYVSCTVSGDVVYNLCIFEHLILCVHIYVYIYISLSLSLFYVCVYIHKGVKDNECTDKVSEGFPAVPG